jgi:hypothetical protein
MLHEPDASCHPLKNKNGLDVFRRFIPGHWKVVETS